MASGDAIFLLIDFVNTLLNQPVIITMGENQKAVRDVSPILQESQNKTVTIV